MTPGEKTPLTHTRCKKPVSLAVLLHDVAIYVWCPTCNDIVEAGELEGLPTEDDGVAFNKNNYAIFKLAPGDVLMVK
jgi:hypothetical protein